MMKYFIFIIIITMCALMDFFTGYVKARINNNVQSKAMRIGGLHKITEIVVMIFVSALGVGFEDLSEHYGDPLIPSLCGSFTVGGTFFYMVLMELISIFENLSGIFPSAKWIRKMCKKLKAINNESEDNNDER